MVRLLTSPAKLAFDPALYEDVRWDGIQFKVTAEEMELGEVVKVVASIIRPESGIVLEP